MQFFQMVQDHERGWGQNEYAGRPTLQKVLEAQVVVFWRTTKDTPAIITLHKDLDEVGRQLARQIVVGDKFERSLSKIFVDKKPMRIASVNVEFAEEPEA